MTLDPRRPFRPVTVTNANRMRSVLSSKARKPTLMTMVISSIRGLACRLARMIRESASATKLRARRVCVARFNTAVGSTRSLLKALGSRRPVAAMGTKTPTVWASPGQAPLTKPELLFQGRIRAQRVFRRQPRRRQLHLHRRTLLSASGRGRRKFCLYLPKAGLDGQRRGIHREHRIGGDLDLLLRWYFDH